MILQTDNRLNDNINRFGCYFMSLLFVINKHVGYKLSTVVITKLYLELVELRFMDTNCYIKDPEGILNYLGLKCKYTNRHEPPKYKAKHGEIEILCLQYPNYKHFVAGDGNGNISFNPMGVTADNAYIHSKRIFKLL